MTPEILMQNEDGVMTLTLNRPEQKNALNLSMYSALTRYLQDARSSPEVRVLLLHGSDECFTAGNDLRDFANQKNFKTTDNPIGNFLLALSEFPKPVVTAVSGVAVGIGTTLLLHSDLVYAAPDARFRMPFINLGLCPEFASSLLLPRLAGHVKAAEWLMLGEFFSAEDALAGKLINAIVDDPITFAKLQCNKLTCQPPEALRTAKALMTSHDRQQILDAINGEMALFTKALQGPEFAEAVAAFFEKRTPDFSRFG